MMKCFLYGVLLTVTCSWLQFTQSAPTFHEEYVHIKVHLPVEVKDHHHHIPPAVYSHGKVIHHHYHKRRRPSYRHQSDKHIASSSHNADDILEALIVATAKKTSFHHHHHHEYHPEPEEDHIVQQEEAAIEQDEVSPEDLGYRPIHVHDAYGYQLYDKPDDHSADLSLLKAKRPNSKYLPSYNYDDESHLESIHHSPKHYHHAEIETDLGETKSHFRPLVYDDSSTLRYADEDFHYPHKPVAEDENLEIGSIYQPELTKTFVQKFEPHEHKEAPIGVEYVHKIPNAHVHKIPEDYLPDYLGKVRQVAEYPTVEGTKTIPHHKHPDYEGYDEPSSGDHSHLIHSEHSSHEDSRTVAVDGALVDWPSHIVRGSADTHHSKIETYDGPDSYSASHVQGAGSGGYHYDPPIIKKIKKK